MYQTNKYSTYNIFILVEFQPENYDVRQIISLEKYQMMKLLNLEIMPLS